MDWRSSLFATTVARSFSHSVMRSANALFGMFVSFLPFSPQPLREVEHGAGDSEVAAGMAAGQCDGDVLQGLHDHGELAGLLRKRRDVAREPGRHLGRGEPADVIDRPEV